MSILSKATPKNHHNTLLIGVMVASLMTLPSLLTGCSEKIPQPEATEKSETVHPTDLAADEMGDANEPEGLASIAPASTRNKEFGIDWSQVDSKVAATDTTKFSYPFALDSDPVKSYVDFFNVTAQEAQHTLTVGMGGNEPLNSLLTQLGDSYVSHELIDGKDVKLVVHTTPNVSASRYDYVIANDFAKGLVLPIEIKPDTKVSK